MSSRLKSYKELNQYSSNHWVIALLICVRNMVPVSKMPETSQLEKIYWIKILKYPKAHFHVTNQRALLFPNPLQLFPEEKGERGEIKMTQFYFLLECMFYEDKDCLTLYLGQSPELVGLVQEVGRKTRWIKVIDGIF